MAFSLSTWVSGLLRPTPRIKSLAEVNWPMVSKELLRKFGTAEAIMERREQLLKRLERVHPQLRAFLDEYIRLEELAEAKLKTDPLEANRLNDIIDENEKKLQSSFSTAETIMWNHARAELRLISSQIRLAQSAAKVASWRQPYPLKTP